MSDVGSIAIDDGGFMGPNYSEDLNQKIDKAIKDISDECYLNALTILNNNRACLDRVADELCENETISGAAKDGHTDLLTMTVFFHVLMGAVDEAAQGASRSAALEETGASPSKSTASEGGSLALQSIHEEGAAVDPATQGGETATPLVPGLAPQEEGRRIVELLLRFDPIRLRTEFQPLYSHRMHYQTHQACLRSAMAQDRLSEKKEEVIVVNPSIDSKSRAMADELLKKQKGESGTATHPELLMWRHRKAEERKAELRSKIRTQEVSGCTFRPKCNPAKQVGSKEGQVEILTPAGSTRAEVLYERGLADKKEREKKVPCREDDA
eukprot:g14163.t1